MRRPDVGSIDDESKPRNQNIHPIETLHKIVVVLKIINQRKLLIIPTLQTYKERLT